MRPLTFLFWTSLVLPAVFAALIAWHLHQQALENAARTATRTAATLREHALRVFEAQQMAIDRIDSRLAGLDWATIEESVNIHLMLKRIARQSPHIDGIWLVDKQGRIANSADYFPVPDVAQSPPGGREYFDVLRESDVTHLGRMIQGVLHGDSNFNISRRRHNGVAGFDGLILVTISLDYFERVWRQTAESPTTAVAILRADGEVLARSPGVEHLPVRVAPDSPFYDMIRRQASGRFTFTSSVDGARRLYAYNRLSTFPAYVAVGIDLAAALAPWWRQAAVLALLAAGTSAALVAMVAMAGRHERRLAEEARRRVRAEHTLVATEEHVAALERAEAALRASQERFRTLFERLTQGVVYQDGDGRIQSANDAAAEILGVPIADLIGQTLDEPHWDLTAEDGAPIAAGRTPARIALTTGEVIRGAVIGIHNPAIGDRRWLIVDAIPQQQPGEPAPSATCMLFSDVTEKRRADAAQQLLLREVDHRAKNALAVVVALMRLTRADSAGDFVATVEGRIDALARAHTLLARSRWSGAELGAVVAEELVPYGGADRERVEIAGPRLMLTADAVQPIGMVIHELATNAAKYGALSAPSGRLSVTWRVAADGAGVALCWQERGGPAVVAPRRTGFGSQLIRSSIESQLDGTVTCHWQPEGLTVEMTLRSATLAPPPPPARAPAPAPRRALRPDALAGATVLLAEDNVVIAMELESTLATLGCVTLGPARTLAEAERLAEAGGFDLALLDVDLGGHSILPLAERIAARAIPVVFCTGFGDLGAPPERWGGAILLRKPVNREMLAAALARAALRTGGVAAARPSAR